MRWSFRVLIGSVVFFCVGTFYVLNFTNGNWRELARQHQDYSDHYPFQEGCYCDFYSLICRFQNICVVGQTILFFGNVSATKDVKVHSKIYHFDTFVRSWDLYDETRRKSEFFEGYSVLALFDQPGSKNLWHFSLMLGWSFRHAIRLHSGIRRVVFAWKKDPPKLPWLLMAVRSFENVLADDGVPLLQRFRTGETMCFARVMLGGMNKEIFATDWQSEDEFVHSFSELAHSENPTRKMDDFSDGITIIDRNCSSRSIFNKEVVIKVLEDAGIKHRTVYLEDITLAQSVDLMESSGFVLASHGAGIMNTIFVNRNIGFLFELFPFGFVFPCFRYLSSYRFGDTNYEWYVSSVLVDHENQTDSVCLTRDVLKADIGHRNVNVSNNQMCGQWFRSLPIFVEENRFRSLLIAAWDKYRGNLLMKTRSPDTFVTNDTRVCSKRPVPNVFPDFEELKMDDSFPGFVYLN